MTLVVPNVGEEAFLDLILAAGYTLKLFTNNLSVSGTAAEALTAGGFTEATFTGYTSKALTGGSWVTTPADPSTGTYALQSFTSTADQTPQVVYGYFVVLTSGGALRWYEKFSSSVTIQNDGDSIRVTPRITLADTQD